MNILKCFMCINFGSFGGHIKINIFNKFNNFSLGAVNESVPYGKDWFTNRKVRRFYESFCSMSKGFVKHFIYIIHIDSRKDRTFKVSYQFEKYYRKQGFTLTRSKLSYIKILPLQSVRRTATQKSILFPKIIR